jgi:alpha-beta hydrolase superfamily lysophospholipase
MKHDEGSYSGDRGLRIYYQFWLPDGAPRAVVQISHGFGEHGGRYQNVVNALILAGIAVYASDHRGNGKSDGQRNYVDSFGQYVSDLKILTDIIHAVHPGVPLFLLGHSMGSTIAIRYAALYREGLAGLILSGAGVKVAGNINPVLISLSGILSAFAPRLTAPTGGMDEFLSHDPAVAEACRADPLCCGDKVSARLGYESTRAFARNSDLVGIVDVPLLYQAGDADRLVLGAEPLSRKFRMKDRTIRMYPGLYHEVYNERADLREPVLRDLVNWLNSHI